MPPLGRTRYGVSLRAAEGGTSADPGEMAGRDGPETPGPEWRERAAAFPRGGPVEPEIDRGPRGLARLAWEESKHARERPRLRCERAACRDATLAELAHLDTLSSDQLLRQPPAVLDTLFERLDLNPPQAPGKG